MDHGMENGGELVGVGTKNPRKKTRIEHLPRHLLAEILCRLPVKSLLRCKCVRRSWRGAVSYVMYNPVMVAENFKRSCARPSLLVKAPRILRRRQRKTIAKGLAGAGFFLDSSIACSGPAFLKRFHSSLSCCYAYECAGIVCLYNLDCTSTIVLMNPTLGLFKVLNRSWWFRRTYYIIKRQCIGFGIDVVGNVYKVVRIIFNGGDNVAELCTLDAKKKMMSWKRISGRTDYIWCGSPRQDQQVSCNGVYYWLGDNRRDQSNGKPILSFDMHSETFGSIHWPEFDEPALPYRATCSLLVWRNERVVLLRYSKEDAEAVPRPIELWVFREACWSKFLTVPPLDYVYCPLTFWNDDELVLKSFSSSTQGHHFASYNILTKTYTRLPWIADLEGKIYVSSYVPSLFWFW